VSLRGPTRCASRLGGAHFTAGGSRPGPFLKQRRGPTLDEDWEKGSYGCRAEFGLNVIDGLIDDVARLIGESPS
jgi:hypothetical protein